MVATFLKKSLHVTSLDTRLVNGFRRTTGRFNNDGPHKYITVQIPVDADWKLPHFRALCRLKIDPGVLLDLPNY